MQSIKSNEEGYQPPYHPSPQSGQIVQTLMREISPVSNIF